MTTTAVRAPRRTARFWAVELIPQCVLGAATVGFVVTKFNAVRSAAESLQAVAILTAVGIGWLAFSFVVMPWLVRNQIVRVVLSSAVAIGLAWALYANAYDDKKVVERLAGLEARSSTTIAPAATLDDATPGSTLAPAVPVRVRSAAFRQEASTGCASRR